MSAQPEVDPDRVKRLTGGQAMVEALVENDVDTVFGIPGIQLDPLYDALHAKRNQIRLVHTRHEQGAAFMAMGYAQATGRTGVFAVVPGPGLLNAMAAVSSAVAATAPVLGITGQIPSHQIGMGYGIAHELRDQLAMSAGVVDWAKRAEHPTQVAGLVNDALRHIHGGRKKPAILEMAPDQYYASAPVETATRAVIEPPPTPDPGHVEAMAARLARAECPAIFIGGGAYGAEDVLLALAERLRAPVIISPSGLGALSDEHPLAYNILCGQDIWDDIDVALVVGTRFIAPALAWGRQQEVEVLRIDVDPNQVRKPRPASVSLVTSAAVGLRALLDELPGEAPPRDAYLARCDAARAAMHEKLATLGPLRGFSEAVRNALPRDAILVTDITQLGYYTRFGYPVYEPRTWMTAGYQATLGYGLPAALGAKVAKPERAVVSICGDGGFMFAVQELATAVHHCIAAIHVVVDNEAYGNVKTIQAQSFGARHIGVDLSNPDFVALGKAFGMKADVARTPEDLEMLLARFIREDEPALIHVPMGEVPSIWDFVRRPPSAGVDN
ncbi:MAG: thiamine pyrophosphate-dependent enzyme [Gammaproteobacteria bacterium]